MFELSQLVKRRGGPGLREGRGVGREGSIPLSPPKVPLSRDALPATEDSLCVEIEADPATTRG